MYDQGVDILAFGAHADDVEIGMGGSLAKWATEGKEVIICDLTEAELSSNGDVVTRREEAQKSAEILGVRERLNLSFPDRGLAIVDEHIREMVRVIREYKPRVIFAPFHKDRHPDHGHCSQLVTEAFFSSGIRKYQVSGGIPTHKPAYLYHYMINGFTTPTFLVNITNYIDQKVRALQAYESQFFINQNRVHTPLTEGYIETVTARERLFGKEVGVSFAEGFISNKPLLLHNDLFGEEI
ncbi:bacillithiol biosynthesis deacetylase BshB1 [Lederbergia sp. NSJ-179]|uniref:bacillithiol biosynthesis deacetylase BshB1 n=1 Tax=Lederbergia sp. NSJ-179 TaxID=2931402 RepID=UPI001FD34C08|nr:bacillithiol biosynthesis deacetylase BshB1 [Lederbergia sp. NSJ-179]MCJ7839477.1 bacillithiol biosynthesis deacetylase BshB1 [Lederbergia sp. NSJ-179]